MKKRFVFIAIFLIALAFIIVSDKSVESQGTCPTPNIIDYTTYPPFITSTSVNPSVMLVIDNSGSMFRFAYPDGWATTIDNYCTDSGDPCDDFVPGFDYYGYFDYDWYYTYGGNKFSPSRAKTETKVTADWDGNFLNWLTMRRVDIIRLALTGGKPIGAGANTRLQAELADCNARGRFKDVANPDLYTPYAALTNFEVIVKGGADCAGELGGGRSDFKVNGVSGTPTYRIEVVVPPDPVGILQNTWTSIRWGISVYNANRSANEEGGEVIRHITNNVSRNDYVNDLNGNAVLPDGNTPLAEMLWTDVGYFANTSSWSSIGSPGPDYNTTPSYSTTTSNDPWNYGTGGQPLYVPCAKCAIIYLTDGEPCADGYLPATLSDYAGVEGSPFNCTGSNCPSVSNFAAQTLPSCGVGGYSAGIEDVALFMRTNDIRTAETSDLDGVQNLRLYTVFAFAGSDSTLLQYASINGWFNDLDGDGLPYSDPSCRAAGADPTPSNPDAFCKEWDENSDGEPDNYFKANADGIETAIESALQDILNRSSSGGAASVLATTGEGEGTVYQAYFIPGTPGSTATEANWRGYVHGLWLDKYGNLREDTVTDATLDYAADYILVMRYDSDLQKTMVRRWEDTDDDGEGDIDKGEVELKNISPIWEAGKVLWNTTPSARKIYTTIDGSAILDINVPSVYDSTDSFVASNASTLKPYLGASDTTEAENIINYIRGNNISDYRTRSFTIGATTKNWKLGDVIYATPTLVSKPAERLNLIYGDSTYADFVKKWIDRRHMLYVGANDGMLHAFNAGKFTAGPPTSFLGDGYTLGEEMWAFIPRELLPHLKWLTDPDYTHVNYVDLKPKIVDARIFDVDDDHPYGWGTILIGGMRYGGKEICVTDDFGSGEEDRTFRSSYFALDITNPEEPPKLLWTFTHSDLPLTTSYPAVLRVGDRSAEGTYFVVFGSGPTDYDATSTQTGRIFTLKISGGSDGVISTWTAGTNYWESGVDFFTGAGDAVIDDYAFMADPATVDVDLDYEADIIYVGDTYCDNPIAGGTPEMCSSSNWNGKMYRIATKLNAASAPSSSPTDWSLSVLFDSGLPTNPQATNDPPGQPITSSVNAAMDAIGNLWVFFGTGRFWHTNDRAADGEERWSFYGIKDTCKPWLDPTASECDTPIDIDDLYNSTSVDVCLDGTTDTCPSVYGTPNLWTNIIANAGLKKGWYLEFPDQGERALSRPLVIGGLVAWTTYTPNPDDPCEFEGNSRLYATYYTTGTAYYKYVFDQTGDTVLRYMDLGVGVPSAVGGVVTGENTLKGFVQQSTGTIVEIEQITPFGLRSRLVGWRLGGP